MFAIVENDEGSGSYSSDDDDEDDVDDADLSVNVDQEVALQYDHGNSAAINGGVLQSTESSRRQRVEDLLISQQGLPVYRPPDRFQRGKRDKFEILRTLHRRIKVSPVTIFYPSLYNQTKMAIEIVMGKKSRISTESEGADHQSDASESS